MSEKYLGIGEFSKFMGCCPATAYKLLKEKKVRSFRIGSHWRVPLEAAEEYVRGGGGEQRQSETQKAA